MSESVQGTYQLAVRAHKAGELDRAEQLYREILASVPHHAEALHMLGVLLDQKGCSDQAVELIRKAIARNPLSVPYRLNLAAVLETAGRLDDAAQELRAAARDRGSAAACFRLAGIEQKCGRKQEAMAAYRQAISLKPDFPEAHNNLGVMLEEQGKLPEAILAYQTALASRKDYGDALANLASALAQENRLEELREIATRAVAMRPDLATSHNHHGAVLFEDGRSGESIASFRRALQIRPDYADAWSNLGSALNACGRADEAESAYRTALRIKPDLADAHVGLSELLLAREEYGEGWKHFEWRRQTREWLASHPPFPPLATSIDEFAGRKVRLRAEQGLGDTIQFVRFVKVLKRLSGAEIFLECQPALVRLLRGQCGLSGVSSRVETSWGAQVEFPLLSLPGILAAAAGSISESRPYITCDPSGLEFWRARVAGDTGRPRIGLNWAGNPLPRRNLKRTVGLAALLPLLKAPATFYSLQKGDAALDARRLSANLVDWTDQFTDFADTAALISALDLVITCDTSVAHLAGALGKQTWVLLPSVADWRWQYDPEDSAWYPTMRLFRQRSAGDWDEVVDRVGKALASWIHELV